MKKILMQIMAVLLLMGVLFGISQPVAATDGDQPLFASQIEKDREGVYRLAIKNNGAEDLRDIQGNTTVPTALKKDFPKATVSWQLKSLKAGETKTIALNQVSSGKLPAFGSKSSFGLLGLGMLLVVAAVFFLIKKGRWSWLLLLLVLGALAPATTALAAETKGSADFETAYKAGDGKEHLFKTKVTFEKVAASTGDSSSSGGSEGTEPSGTPGDDGSSGETQELTIAGTAYGAEGKALADKMLTLTGESGTTKVKTDAQGYFYTRIAAGKDYQIKYKEQLTATVNVKTIKDFQVANQRGIIDLGKKISGTEGSEAYAKLNISTIYFEDMMGITSGDKTISFSQDPKLQPGDIVMIPEGGPLGNGYTLKVTASKKVNGKTVISGTEPQILEVFQAIDTGQEGLLFGEPQVELAEGVTFEPKQGPSSRVTLVDDEDLFRVEGTFDPTEKLKKIDRLKGFMKNVDELQMDYETYAKGTVKVSILGGDNEVAVTAGSSVDARMKLTKEADFEAEFHEELGRIKVPTQIPTLTVDLPIDLVGSFEAEGELEVNVQAAAAKDVGFSYKNGQLTTSGLNNDLEKKLNINGRLDGSLEAELGLAPAVALNIVSMDLAEIKAEAGANYELKAGLDFGAGIEPGDMNLDVRGDTALNAYGKFKVGSPLVGELGGEEVLFDREFEVELQKTKEMKVKKAGTATADTTIYVSPGERVELIATDNEGNEMPTGAGIGMVPLYLLNTTIKDVGQSANGISFTVQENAQPGEKVTVRAFQLMYGILIGGQTRFDIIVGEEPKSGDLTGSIADAISDQPVKGAKLEFFNDEGTVVKTATTDEAGNYQVSLAEGTYKTVITADGYIEEINHIEVTEGTTTYDAKLRLVGSEFAGTGQALGSITDAVTGNGVTDVKLTFRKGRNTTTGAVLGSTTSQEQGAYTVSLPGGNYTMEMEKDGYFKGYANILVLGDKETANQNGTITPNELGSGQYRVVLTWGENPSDIDTHLHGDPLGEYGGFHLYYSNKTVSDEKTEAFLDVDDTTSYGPETLTIDRLDPAVTYHYNIEYYTGMGTLADSQAQVQVYDGSGLINTFNVPAVAGTKWEVFKIANGKILPVNTMTERLGRLAPK